MKITFTEDSWSDYNWAQKNPSILKKINDLIKDINRNPFRGLGKPEPLKGPLSGYWSRRITKDHRLVYRIQGNSGNQVIEIIMCRYHY